MDGEHEFEPSDFLTTAPNEIVYASIYAAVFHVAGDLRQPEMLCPD